MADVDYEDIAFQARQAVTAVYDALGPGFREETYKAALEMEFREREIPYETGKIIEVNYKGKHVDDYKLDFVLFDKVLLNVLAEGEYRPKYKARVVSQIKAARFKIGLLIDFGMQKLNFHKILNPDFYFGPVSTDESPARPSKSRDTGEKRSKFDNLFGE